MNIDKKKIYKFSIITFAIGAIILLLTFFCFHFVTDDGITLIWHEEAGKPFVTYMLGVFGVLFVFSSIISLLISYIFGKK